MVSRKAFSITVAALFAVAIQLPTIEAQSRICGSNNVISGSYGVAASRAGFFLLGATAPTTSTAGTGSTVGTGPIIAVGVTPPGSTGATVWSQTSIGTLVGDLASPNVFTTVSRVVADGNGNLYASAAPSGAASTLVGTYTVAVDCSVVMNLNDAFSAAATGSTTGLTTSGMTTTSGPTSVITSASAGPAYTAQFEGEVMNSGSGFSQIYLIQTNAGSGGATMTLQQTTQSNGCTNGSLVGNYAITGSGDFLAGSSSGTTTTIGAGGTSGTGTTTTTTGVSTTTTSSTTPVACSTAGAGTTTGTSTTTTNLCATQGFVSGVASNLGTPFTLLGRFVADGNGNLVEDSAALASPVNLGITGTYTVNPDCTGTARLSDSAGLARNINFVLVEQSSQAAGPKQQLNFVFSDAGVFGSGYASPQ